MIFCSSIMRSARTRRCSDSSRRNPRSRNTLPVDGVIFSFLGKLSSCQAVCATPRDQSSIPLPGKLQVAAPGLPRALLERMKHIDGLDELGDVEHPMLKRCVNSNLADAWPDARHGLPVQGIQALL